MTNDDVDYWEHYNQFRKILKNEDIDDTYDLNNITHGFKCKNCSYLEYNTIDVCTNCGLVINNEYLYDSFHYDNELCNDGEENIENYNKRKKSYNSNGKMSKMSKWISESNNEKHEYKLLLYVKNLCNKLNIQTHINYIYDITSLILKLIKQRDGTKRARVKDGIIIVCIYYTFKKNDLYTNQEFTLQNIAKNVNIDLKYIRQAEKTIIDLISKKLIDLEKNILLNVKTPIEYIQEIKDIFISNLKYTTCTNESLYLFIELKELIKYIENNELLLDIAPYNITVGCFYYILKNNIDKNNKNNINNINNIYIRDGDITNLMFFSKLYNISYTTVQKIYKKCLIFGKI